MSTPCETRLTLMQTATELIWGVPDRAPDEVLASLDRLAGRLGLG